MQTPNILSLSFPDCADSKNSQIVSHGYGESKHITDCLHLIIHTQNIINVSLLDYEDSKHSQIISLGYVDCEHSQIVST